MSIEQSDLQIIPQIVHEPISAIKPVLNKGKVNRIYIVELGTYAVVIRLNDASEIERFTKEQWCMSKASKIGIPSPQVWEYGIINKTAYMLLNYIPGLNGEEITENLPSIWKTLGSYARKIHSIPTKGFGETLSNPGEFNGSWEKYVTYNVNSLHDEDKLLSMNVITHDQSILLRNLFEQLAEKHFDFGLTHGDIALANIIVENGNITLIDWGSAESTIVPHFELIGIFEDSLQENSPLFDNFLDGYGLSRKEFNAMKQDLVSLTLLRSVDKLRWAIDRKTDLIHEYSTRVKNHISTFL